MRVLFDTGSSYTWFLTQESAEPLGVHNFYKRAQSTTFFDPKNPLRVGIQFGIGSLSGRFYQDSLIIGDPLDPLNQIKLNDFVFGYTFTADVFDGEFEAIVGLAYPGLNKMEGRNDGSTNTGILPFFDQLMAKGVLERNVFSFYMSMNPFDTSIDQSEMVMGYIDDTRYTGAINWNPVIVKEFWSIPLEEILYNGVSLNICSQNNCEMTPDSGTTLMTMPTWALDRFLGQTFQPNLSCSDNLAQFGTLTLVIGGVNYDIKPHHWVRRRIDSQNQLGGTCSSVFRGSDIQMTGHENLFAIGDVFMQLWFTIFDRDQDRIGFAKAVH